MNKLIKYLNLLACIFLFPINVLAYSSSVYLGGENIGIAIKCKGILVVGFYQINGTLNNSELIAGDYITKVEDIPVSSVEELINAIDTQVHDNVINLTFQRNNLEKSTSLHLEYQNGIYKTGLYVKDSLLGVGTLTYIDPNTKVYGALGHEILESSTKKRIEVKTGSIFKSIVTSIDRSSDGAPGSKNAKFYKITSYGTINTNISSGIYGTYGGEINKKELIPVGKIEDVTIGPATIYTVTSGDDIASYQINILRVDKSSTIKNYYFEVIDPTLLKITGGIIQGMSGSPIVQNNKLIGAVTHVAIDDVAKGYGINIETMLNAGDKTINP